MSYTENNKENETGQELDMSASCCMEVAGIESMVPGIEAPKIGDMSKGNE